MNKFAIAKYLLLTGLFFSIILFSSCNKDDGDNTPDNETELITTVILTFVNSNNVSFVFKASDPDGTGGNPPAIDPVILEANETYSLFVAFLDESDPANIEDITQEVRDEANEHLVCFEASGLTSGPTPVDMDDNGDPLGLESRLSTGDAASGSLKISLKHEADKSSSNACGTGETDAEVTFPMTIQ